jgi:hypothetical protein
VFCDFICSILSMLGEQTSKKFKVVVWRESKGCFLGFLGFGLHLLLVFPFITRGIYSELNDKLGLKAGRGNVPFSHER